MYFDINHLFLTTDGRIGRQSFWIGAIALAIVSIVIGLIVGAVFGWISLGSRLINFIVQLALAYPAYALLAKRFQDRAKPSSYAAAVVGINILYSLLTLVGITGSAAGLNAFGMLFGLVMFAIFVWIVIELGILRGTVGKNAYGPDPVQA